jgi:hypothetical protein
MNSSCRNPYERRALVQAVAGVGVGAPWNRSPYRLRFTLGLGKLFKNLNIYNLGYERTILYFPESLDGRYHITAKH